MSCAQGYQFNVKPRQPASAGQLRAKAAGSVRSVTANMVCQFRESAEAGLYASGPNQKWVGDTSRIFALVKAGFIWPWLPGSVVAVSHHWLVMPADDSSTACLRCVTDGAVAA